MASLTRAGSAVRWYQGKGISDAGGQDHMPAPCRKCGATKTEPVSEVISLRYELARLFGYELRQCARCRCLRLLKRRAAPRQHRPPLNDAPVTGTAGGTEEGATRDTFNPVLDNAAGGETSQGEPNPDEPHGVASCPRCGSRRYRRSRRRWLERVMRRPAMARCKACHFRFPLPQRLKTS